MKAFEERSQGGTVKKNKVKREIQNAAKRLKMSIAEHFKVLGKKYGVKVKDASVT